jgi:uncharacterized protein (DUF433 family)
MPAADLDILRRTPAYAFSEAAHYLGVPSSTLRAWFLGQINRDARGSVRRFHPILRLDGNRQDGLSFLNLVEAHVLAGLRRAHGLSLPNVRRALRYVSRTLGFERPLIDARFQTDGASLLVEQFGGLINASRGGQVEMAHLMQAYLQRIEWADDGLPIKLYPFTRRESALTAQVPRPVVVDPRIAFGRPALSGRAVPTAVLADRFKAGDTLDQLAEDYDTAPEAIEEAIRCELYRQAA